MAALCLLHVIGSVGELWHVRALLSVLGLRTRAALDGGCGWLSRRASGKLHDVATALSPTCELHQ